MIPTVYAQTVLGPGPAGVVQAQQLVLRIISLAVGGAFFLLTILLVYGGVRFIMSGGDQKNLASARQIIIQAIVGIVFMAAAWLILRLISAFTGTDVTNFCLGFPGSTNGCS